MDHNTLIQSAHFHAISINEKRFEIFDAVSGIQKGDRLNFREVVLNTENKLEATGREMQALVSFISYLKEGDKIVASLIVLPAKEKTNEPQLPPATASAPEPAPSKGANGASLGKGGKRPNGGDRKKPAPKRPGKKH
jgi:hypothetical protein